MAWGLVLCSVLYGEGEIELCGMRMQILRTCSLMADAEVAKNVGI